MAKEKEIPVTKKQLIAAAEDMNELMGLDPAIDPEGDEDEMIEEIKANVQYIEPQDLDNVEDPEEEFQEETVQTLRKLGIKLPGDKEEPEEEEEPEAQRDTSYHPKAKAGIIAFILDLIRMKGPVSKKRILKELVRRFPERDEKGMKNTVNIQVPGRITKKHGKILKKTVTSTGVVRWSMKKKKGTA